MADIDDVLERLVTDPTFRAHLGADPAAALAGYELSPRDVELLASSLDDTDADLPRGVEQRTSKSALLGLLSSLAPSGGGLPAAPGDPVPTEQVSFTYEHILDSKSGDDIVGPGEFGGEAPSRRSFKVADVQSERGAIDQAHVGVDVPGNPAAPWQPGGDDIGYVDKREAIGESAATRDLAAERGDEASYPSFKYDLKANKEYAVGEKTPDTDLLAPDGGYDIGNIDNVEAVGETRGPLDTIASPADVEEGGLLLPAVQKVRDAPSRPAAGAELLEGALVDEQPESQSRVSKIEAITVKQTALTDIDPMAPANPDGGPLQQAVSPSDEDFLTIEDE